MPDPPSGAGRMGEPPGRLGSLILRARWGTGLTQEELAAKCGLSIRTISDIERGRVASPRSVTLRRLAAALGMTDTETRDLLLLARFLGSPAASRQIAPGAES